MFDSDDKIERKFRSKSAAFASGVITGGTLAALLVLTMFIIFVTFGAYIISRCEVSGGMVLKTMTGDPVCVHVEGIRQTPKLSKTN